MSDYPLGEPIRPQAPEPDEWVPVEGRPFMEVNRKTGMWRNVRPTPPVVPVHPWYGLPVRL